MLRLSWHLVNMYNVSVLVDALDWGIGDVGKCQCEMLADLTDGKWRVLQ